MSSVFSLLLTRLRLGSVHHKGSQKRHQDIFEQRKLGYIFETLLSLPSGGLKKNERIESYKKCQLSIYQMKHSGKICHNEEKRNRCEFFDSHLYVDADGIIFRRAGARSACTYV